MKYRTPFLGIFHIISVITGCASFAFASNSATADVPPGQITHVYMNLLPPSNGQGSASLQSQYAGLIGSLRNAAAHPYRNGVLITEQQRFQGLVRLTLTLPGSTDLSLWITPQDLYVRGFTNHYGFTFQFNDSDYNLLDALDRLRAASPQGGTTLPFGSNYSSITNAAGRGRESTPFSYVSFWNAFLNLAYAQRPSSGEMQNIARSLMLMIQMTSEAARFNDVFGLAHDSMGFGHHAGLPTFQQYLENSWAQISEYGLAVTQMPTTRPTIVTGINPNTGNSPRTQGRPYTLSSFSDVVRFLAVMTSSPFDSNTGGINGDWRHDEL